MIRILPRFQPQCIFALGDPVRVRGVAGVGFVSYIDEKTATVSYGKHREIADLWRLSSALRPSKHDRKAR